MNARLSLALSVGAVSMPPAGHIVLLRPPGDLDLEGLPLDRVVAVQGFYPDHAALQARGVAMASGVEGAFATAVVFAARAKALTLDLLAQAIATVGAGGTVIVDGAKGDGIDSVLRQVRAIAEVSEVYAKAHGKCFAFSAPISAPDGWAAAAGAVDGFVTTAGVFSADGVDPGSALLADHLSGIAGRVCDLGAGWGYLSARALTSDKISRITLVEAEQAALDCARLNVTDPRATFHWADATSWAGGPFDLVICNPPFHTARKADPSLGRAFVASAARILTPRGRLLMVANRHLPYEATIQEAFSDINVLADVAGYKVIEAARPKRKQP